MNLCAVSLLLTARSWNSPDLTKTALLAGVVITEMANFLTYIIIINQRNTPKTLISFQQNHVTHDLRSALVMEFVTQPLSFDTFFSVLLNIRHSH